MRTILLSLFAFAFVLCGCQNKNELEGPTSQSTYRSTYTQPEPILPPGSRAATTDESEVVEATSMRAPIAGTEASESSYGPAGRTIGETTEWSSHTERQDDLERLDSDEGTPTPRPATNTGFTYTIRKDDTLWRLSETYLGAGKRWREIRDANPGINYEALPVGKDIWIPAK